MKGGILGFGDSGFDCLGQGPEAKHIKINSVNLQVSKWYWYFEFCLIFLVAFIKKNYIFGFCYLSH